MRVKWIVRWSSRDLDRVLSNISLTVNVKTSLFDDGFTINHTATPDNTIQLIYIVACLDSIDFLTLNIYPQSRTTLTCMHTLLHSFTLLYVLIYVEITVQDKKPNIENKQTKSSNNMIYTITCEVLSKFWFIKVYRVTILHYDILTKVTLSDRDSLFCQLLHFIGQLELHVLYWFTQTLSATSFTHLLILLNQTCFSIRYFCESVSRVPSSILPSVNFYVRSNIYFWSVIDFRAIYNFKL